MTADFRALCVELTDCLEKADWPLRHRYVFRQWIDIARAALAGEPAVPEVVGSEWQPCVKLPITVHVREQRPGEPAVPEGREPVAVTEQPSDEELVGKLVEAANGAAAMGWDHHAQDAARKAASAVLARWGNHVPTPPADGEVAGLVADMQQQANHGFSDLTRNLLINLASHMAYMQGQLQARHDPDEDDLEDCYWYAESVALRQMVSDALTGEPAALLPLADTHYEWELEDAKGEWQAGGSSNSQSDVEREGMRYLQTYTQDGPHKLIIRQHTTQTINEITNG